MALFLNFIQTILVRILLLYINAKKFVKTHVITITYIK